MPEGRQVKEFANLLGVWQYTVNFVGCGFVDLAYMARLTKKDLEMIHIFDPEVQFRVLTAGLILNSDPTIFQINANRRPPWYQSPQSTVQQLRDFRNDYIRGVVPPSSGTLSLPSPQGPLTTSSPSASYPPSTNQVSPPIARTSSHQAVYPPSNQGSPLTRSTSNQGVYPPSNQGPSQVYPPSNQGAKAYPSPSTSQVPQSYPPSNQKVSAPGNPELLKAVQSIMNNVYKVLRGCFEVNTQYGAKEIVSNVKETIVKTTNECGETPHTPTVKSILNRVYKKFRGEFESGRKYYGKQILQIMKKLIVDTTNELVEQSQPSSSNGSQTDSYGQLFPSPPTATPAMSSSYASVGDYVDEQVGRGIASAAQNKQVQAQVGSWLSQAASNPENQKAFGNLLAGQSDNSYMKYMAQNPHVQNAVGSSVAAAAKNPEVQRQIGVSVANAAQDKNTRQNIYSAFGK
eukprot:TRINITY_DN2687_c0_g1_i1.p1 TRINITY_DN2687_c0_g1~~TRINITY_DN2687_c0_g1_i1.p1  ORF type:complete len:513 (+),score=102.38 TRINITY_DN2687_c0_g1_i1:168-1541(+)